MAKEFVKIGYFIGIDGPITFKNNKKQRQLVKKININNILIETDSPYLSPEPKRGEKNTPLNIKYVIKEIASNLDKSEDEITDITTKNALNLFDLSI